MDSTVFVHTNFLFFVRAVEMVTKTKITQKEKERNGTRARSTNRMKERNAISCAQSIGTFSSKECSVPIATAE